MAEIKCPNCGKVFRVDEAGYAQILQQVRDAELKRQLDEQRTLMEQRPEFAMELAVKGMLPKNTIGKESLKRLHIYADANYEQQAQKPVALDAE